MKSVETQKQVEYDMGYRAGAESERNRIVALLRKEAASLFLTSTKDEEAIRMRKIADNIEKL